MDNIEKLLSKEDAINPDRVRYLLFKAEG